MIEDRLHPAIHGDRDDARSFHSILACLNGLFYRSELRAPWRFSFLSEGGDTLTGYSREELDATSWGNLILPEYMSEIDASVEAAIAAEARFEITYPIRHKDGTLRWVAEQGHAIRDADGQPIFLEGIISDVTAARQAEDVERTASAQWRKMLDTIPQMAWSMSPDGREAFYNERWVDFTGRLINDGSILRLDLIHPDDRDSAHESWTLSVRSGTPYQARYRLIHRSGEFRWVLSRALPERDETGTIRRWYGTCTDIHEQVLAVDEAASARDFAARLLGAAPDALLLLDGTGHVTFCNDVAEKALAGRWQRSLLGSFWADLVPYAVRRSAWRAAARAWRTGEKIRFTVEHSRGRWWDVIATPVDASQTRPRLLVTARDVSDQKHAEQKARWAAGHDTLTDLPNRALLQQRLDAEVVGETASDRPFALLLLDVDDFKRTNDTLGHDAGDALLIALAGHLRAITGGDDMVARLGGDEFAVILPDVTEAEALLDFSRRLAAAMRLPFLHDGNLLECRASIGAALFPDHGASKSDLLKSADLALYAAKAMGGGTLRIFEPGLRDAFHQRSVMLKTGKHAIDAALVVPFYQPKIDLQTGLFAGFEALLRWRDGARIRTPDTIAACFDDPVLAVELGDRMIEQVIRDIGAWRAGGTEFGHVALNASPAEFRHDDFAERLLGRMRQHGLDPGDIQVEVTESVFLGRGAEYVERALNTLAAGGIGIALDDFGTGYASLSHLKRFPVDVIKIDRSFVTDLQCDENDGAIVDAVIGLGRSLRKQVVAEGIETRAQHDLLVALGCHVGQGFLYGRPMPADQVPAALRAERDAWRSAA
ncbi:EAL domain-containing protein [Sphingosinicella sp. BN140058]|uniref:bifunctional diguanylate cyclase/phosphodiesterase n=1 Tax=Sphingosinicella sp. BN140058 TaxID=1892855 RepID=UPI00101146B5|nr:EAL domain-containing protein [Sphingosinicella sp. BN140058]QAY76316.1 EAL domain-containing protein [Sphingosinicella sp. BN140058]